MSRKRARPDSSAISGADADAKLEVIASLEYDRTQIDALVEQYRAAEPTPESERSDAAAGISAKGTTCPMVCCPREYEESFLREPVNPERPCVRGQDCEGLRVRVDMPFVLREFLYPGQEEPPTTRTLCLLCRRNEISKAYYRYETGHVPAKSQIRIADHYNLVGVPGEYDVKDCIVSSSKYCGLPLPVVLHIRSAYTSTMRDGIRYMEQTRMRHPESTSESSSSFLMRRATLGKKVARSKSLLKDRPS